MAKQKCLRRLLERENPKFVALAGSVAFVPPLTWGFVSVRAVVTRQILSVWKCQLCSDYSSLNLLYAWMTTESCWHCLNCNNKPELFFRRKTMVALYFIESIESLTEAGG